jgi:ATP-binding cassette subfamily B protein
MLIGFTQRTESSSGIKRFFVFSSVTAIIAMFIGFLSPLIVGFTVDSVIGRDGSALPWPLMNIYEMLNPASQTDSARGSLALSLLICAVLVALCAILGGLFNYFSRVSMAKFSERMINVLRTKLFSHTQNLPFEWHTKNQTGDTIQRCTSDVETVRRFVFQQFIEVLRTVILVVIATVIMFSLNYTMATIVIIFLPIVMLYSYFFWGRISDRFHECNIAEGALMSRVQENLTGVRVVRAFGREKYETERFDEKNIDFTEKWTSLGTTFGVFWGLGDIVTALQFLCVIIVGSFLASEGRLSIGELLVFISYTQMITWPVRQMGRLLTEMNKTTVALTRIKEIFDYPEETDVPDAVEPPINRDIVFNDVSFSYEEQPVLKNVSFTIKNGTTFGILGATGSGKSTITYLLNALYDLPVDSGLITIGGVDVSKIKKAYLRRNIGLVLQEPFLFSKTIKENIEIAVRNDKNISEADQMEHIREKAKIAAIDDNIMSFVKGYDTIVGERGMTLSGGQKQRVAIARTLMMNSPVMVFDDSMSALDMETDAKIRESLRTDTAGATVVLISHRITTLMKADVIMVLDEGKVSEIGSHDELVARDGIYKRVYDLQSGYYSDDLPYIEERDQE